MAKYEKLATFIIENVGGKNNISNVTHCMTRLRFKLEDESKVNQDKLIENKDIMTAQPAGGKYQVVIGTQVGEVCEEILKQLNMSQEKEDDKVGGSLLNRFTNLITQIMLPSLGAFGASCLIKAVMNVLLALNVIQNGDGAYILLNSMGSAALYFFPILLGYTSAKTFKMNPFLGMLLGMILCYPGMTEAINTGEAMFTLFEGTGLAMPVYKTFFGIPVFFPSMGYTSTVIPVIFSVFCTSKIDHFLNSHVPSALKGTLINFVTITIGGLVTFLVLGPISLTLNNLISMLVTFLFDTSAWLAGAVISLVYMPLVVLGLHWPMLSVGILNYATLGHDIIMAILFPAPFACMGVCLAVYLRTRSNKLKGVCTSAFVSSVFCIIEPAFYGVMLPVKKRFGFGMLGSFIGGMIICMTNNVKYTSGSGVTGYITFINPETGSFQGVIIALIATAVAMLIAFVLTWFSYKPNEDRYEDEMLSEENTVQKTLTSRNETIYSPMKGEVKELSAMDDIAFANCSMGKGVCVVPSEGKVVAPCDGVLTSLFPTGHALGIKSNDGSEVLIHVGTNTVDLGEGIFTKHKKQGDVIKKGDVLTTFDLKQLYEKGVNPETAVVITNTADYLDVVNLAGKNIDYGDRLLANVVSESSKNKMLRESVAV